MPIDYKDYGIEFCVKSAVLRLFGQCAQCGVENGAKIKRGGGRVVLTVHHLNKNRHDHAVNNLAPLCQACHLEQHRRGANPEAVKLSKDYMVYLMNLGDFACYMVKDAMREALGEYGEDM